MISSAQFDWRPRQLRLSRAELDEVLTFDEKLIQFSACNSQQHTAIELTSRLTIDIPTVGYGTWASGDNNWAKNSILTALKQGYRHIDGACMYGVWHDQAHENAQTDAKYTASKAWTHFLFPDNVELALDKILEDTGLEYIDLFLAHWPVAHKYTTREALEKATTGRDATAEQKAQLTGLVKKGKCRAVGVSNFSIADMERLIPHSKEIPISCNQIEVHPWLPQREIIEWSNKQGILTACYSPFAGQKSDGKTLLNDPEVVKLAEKNKMDVGQLLQSWAVQRGTIPLGKSATPKRIKSNLAIQKLSEEDMKKLDSMELPNGEGRTVKPSESWGVELF